MICDGCGKKIRANTAMVTVNTPDTSNHWHLACCPLGKERAPANRAEKERAAA